MDNNFSMVAKTLFGFEELLAKELTQLGARDVKVGVRNVSFVGDKGFMYKCNLALRTAIKILKPIHSFKVKNEQDLYDNLYNMSWEQYLKPTGTLAVDATVHSHLFTHSLYIAQKTKDAIVDKFRDTTGERPNVDLKFPDIKVNVNTTVKKLPNNSYEVTLDIKTEAKKKEKVAFIAEGSQVGIFTLNKIPPDQQKPLLLIEAPRMLFPFARNVLAEITRDGGYPPLMLNPIDFATLYQKQMAAQQQNQKKN